MTQGSEEHLSHEPLRTMPDNSEAKRDLIGMPSRRELNGGIYVNSSDRD